MSCYAANDSTQSRLSVFCYLLNKNFSFSVLLLGLGAGLRKLRNLCTKVNMHPRAQTSIDERPFTFESIRTSSRVIARVVMQLNSSRCSWDNELQRACSCSSRSSLTKSRSERNAKAKHNHENWIWFCCLFQCLLARGELTHIHTHSLFYTKSSRTSGKAQWGGKSMRHTEHYAKPAAELGRNNAHSKYYEFFSYVELSSNSRT